LQGRGDVLQEGVAIADRQRLGGAQHRGELVVGEAERAVVVVIVNPLTGGAGGGGAFEDQT
jgi:hypothetical protein